MFKFRDFLKNCHIPRRRIAFMSCICSGVHMAGRRGRNKTQIANDRAQIASRAVRGESQISIAKDIGLSAAQISRELARVRSDWRQLTMGDAATLVGEQIAKINELERQCWEGWERSKGMSEVSGTEQVEPVVDSRGRRVGAKQVTYIRRATRDGNPKFLDLGRKCIMARCRLLGLFPEVRIIHSGDDYSPPIQVETVVNMRKATPEDLEFLEKVRAKLCPPQLSPPSALPPPDSPNDS